MGNITDIAWSPNGAYLASAAEDGKLLIWETKSQTILIRREHKNVTQIIWHPQKNILAMTTNQGELLTCSDIIPDDHAKPAGRPIHKSPLSHQDHQTSPRRVPNGISNGTHNHTKVATGGLTRHGAFSQNAADDDLLDTLEDAGADWIEDDDGAGYIPNLEHRNKRQAEDGLEDEFSSNKRHASSLEPQIHEPIQPGSTPWRNGRRYLVLNLVGFVWTVAQDDHSTVTVEFHDRDAHRQYHFTDSSGYDKACLDDNGALFTSPAKSEIEGHLGIATIHFRPHESWASNSTWNANLPEEEDVTGLGISLYSYL